MNRIKLAAVSIGAVLLCAQGASATVKPGDGLLWFTGGYAMGTIAESGDSVDGAGMTFAFEQLAADKPISFGVAIGYSEIDDERKTTTPDRTINVTVATVPVVMGGKYWLGQGKVQGFIGASLGLYFSEAKRTVTETSSEYSSVGFTGSGMSIPVGLSVGLGEKLLLSGGYTLNWMWSNEAFDNDILNLFSLGLGYRLGS